MPRDQATTTPTASTHMAPSLRYSRPQVQVWTSLGPGPEGLRLKGSFLGLRGAEEMADSESADCASGLRPGGAREAGLEAGL